MEDLRNPMLKFFSDQELCYAEIVPSAQVRARIEVSVLNFLKNLNASNPAISDLPLIQRKFCNSRVNHSLMTDLSCVFLSHSVSSRSLMRPNAAKAFVRVWKVMELCYQILLQEKRVTQRELYYKLLCDSPHLFPSQIDVNRTIQDVVALLRCSRYSLGIMASSRGLVAGRLTFQEPGKEVVDCSVCGSSAHTIPGDVNLLENLILDTDARYIIIVEKRLAEDQIFNQIPSILVTAKGYPDMATRVLLHRIHRTFPDLPILALVDWNPAGLAILCTFKFGSVTMGLEAYRYACNVKWLGLRGQDLEMLPDESLVPLKPKDLQIAQSLMSSGILQGNYRDEVALMVQSGRRAEIEALYFHGRKVEKLIEKHNYQKEESPNQSKNPSLPLSSSGAK
ncbi:Meiotic recombination protein [Arachis hypogaea]|nr:Meiotic recombination protein [Arachis hypogaea]